MSTAFTALPACLKHATRLQHFVRPSLRPPRRPRRHYILTTSCAIRHSSSSSPHSTAPREQSLQNTHYTPHYATTSVNAENDTIFALATGYGSSAGVAVMRISGPGASHTLRVLTAPPSSTSSSGSKLPVPRMATLRTLYDPNTKEMLDRALVLYFPRPRSFTAEDVVELHLHGSRAVINAVTLALSRIPSPTPRPATRGEFTRRAFEHGALDLIRAEGLADLIAADTSSQRIQALRALSGDASSVVQSWRSKLVHTLARVEATLDFVDDVGDTPLEGLCKDMKELRDDMSESLRRGVRAQVVRSGASVALVGPPNAGKSSLLNVLAQREAAIVAPTAGTTRDVVGVRVDFAGIAATVSDTAGLRTLPSDEVEAEGMRRARRTAKEADVIVCVYDASCTEEELRENVRETLVNVRNEGLGEKDDEEIQDPSSPPHLLYVFNKMDLCNESPLSKSVPHRVTRDTRDVRVLSTDDTFETSLKNGEGVSNLVARIEEVLKTRLETDDVHNPEVAPVITRARHRHHVQKAITALSAFIDGQKADDVVVRMPMDLAAEDLRAACKEVGAITGDVDAEEVLDVIFSEFCIGK